MSRLFLHLIATAGALFVAERLVNGVDMVTPSPTQTVISLVIVTIIFGVVNAVIRPLIKASTCVVNILTLGLFTFVINALMLYLTALIGQQFDLGFFVRTPLAALQGAIVVSIMSVIFGFLIPDK